MWEVFCNCEKLSFLLKTIGIYLQQPSQIILFELASISKTRGLNLRELTIYIERRLISNI